MEGGAPGSYRQTIKDAANGDAEDVDPTVRRMFVAFANKADEESKKIDRIVNLLITTSISIGLLIVSVVVNMLFRAF